MEKIDINANMEKIDINAKMKQESSQSVQFISTCSSPLISYDSVKHFTFQ